MREIRTRVADTHARHFGGDPILVRAPGRVNLIGEHTDYNQGFVLPAAIDKAILLAMSANGTDRIRLVSLDRTPHMFETPVAGTYAKTGVDWANYIIGVVDQLQNAGHTVPGFDCAFGGDIPIGAGMSSSAALEGGIAFGLSTLFDLHVSRLDMARLSMQAENRFVGMQCGIMDQFASLHGASGYAILLDCRSLEFELVPFAHIHVGVLLCDTKVRRALTGSEYNIRRSQCEEGTSVIAQSHPAVSSLRDVTFEQLEAHRDRMDPVVYRRCRFILEETRRVVDACEDLIRNDLAMFGRRMAGSHAGLRDDYQVSCHELDILVEAAEPLDGILGSRMMGGGFGGCTINLVRMDTVDESVARIRQTYLDKTGIEPGFHLVRIGNGTHLIEEA